MGLLLEDYFPFRIPNLLLLVVVVAEGRSLLLLVVGVGRSLLLLVVGVVDLTVGHHMVQRVDLWVDLRSGYYGLRMIQMVGLEVAYYVGLTGVHYLNELFYFDLKSVTYSIGDYSCLFEVFETVTDVQYYFVRVVAVFLANYANKVLGRIHKGVSNTLLILGQALARKCLCLVDRGDHNTVVGH